MSALKSSKRTTLRGYACLIRCIDFLRWTVAPLLLHSGITSQPTLQLVSVKLMFARTLVVACKSSDPVDLHKNLSPRRPAVRGQCALQTRPSHGGKNRRFHDLDW